MKSMNILSHLSYLIEKNKNSLFGFCFLLISLGSFSQNISASITRDSLYKAIKSFTKNDSLYIRKSDSAKKITNDLVAYISRVSEDLKQTSKQNSNYQITTIYFFAPYNGTATIATDLKMQINNYKKLMLLMPDSTKKLNFQYNLNLDDVYSLTENKSVTWEHNSFYDMPVSAAIALLGSLQSQVYAYEEIILRAILKEGSLKKN